MKKVLIWIAAVLLTLVAAVYQRLSGPTYPKKVDISINQKKYQIKLLRSSSSESDAVLEFPIDDTSVTGIVHYKFYPEIKGTTTDSTEMQRKGKILTARLPHQAPAGKLQYIVKFRSATGEIHAGKKEWTVVRFKGSVPGIVLIPHVIFIFFAMLMANVSGLFAVAGISSMRLYTKITFGLMLLGGMIFGPIVQKYAFGEFWTGIPFGWDLTDNKTLIGFTAWTIALILNLRKENRWSIIAAAVVTLVIFSIPHSMFGSELNRETGNVTQGFLYLIPIVSISINNSLTQSTTNKFYKPWKN